MQAAKESITVQTLVAAPLQKVWEYWTQPSHIQCWNHASADWHTPHAENSLHVGGRFSYRMEAKDGTVGFDFAGVYIRVVEGKFIVYTLDDGRKVWISFGWADDRTWIEETFEAETINPLHLQRHGWQAILDNFKKYVESKKQNL